MILTEPIDGQMGAIAAGEEAITHINQELYKRNAELAVRIKTLALLRRLDEISLATFGVDEMAREVVTAVAAEFGYEVVSVAYVEENRTDLKWLALGSAVPDLALSLASVLPRSVKVPITSGLATLKPVTSGERETIYVKEIHEVFPADICQYLEQRHIESTMLFPLLFGKTVLGVFTISASRNLHELTKYEQESIEGIVSLVSLALYKAKLYEDLQHTTVQLRQANQHLKELMDIKTEFLHIASHQLRTPLTGLRGYLEMQAEGEFDQMAAEERRKLQKDMLNAANQLNSIVNDLLDAMELEGGSLNFKWGVVQLEDMVSEIMEQLKPNYDKKKLTLEFKRPETKLPSVEADAGYLRQVFLNVIDNAEKYTLQGGVVITAQALKDKVEIAVKDTGIGIDPEEKDKLFGKFIRGARSQQIHTDGSGLGLFIIKKIVMEHGGEVVLESEGIDNGTTMRIVLPIAQKK